MSRIHRLLGAAGLLLAFTGPLTAQDVERFRVTGYVRQAANGEVVRGAVLTVPTLDLRATSNAYGFFAIDLPGGRHEILVRALGFAPRTEVLEVRGDAERNFTLESRALVLDELSVFAEREPDDIDPESVEMSVARLSVSTLSRVPAVLGEVDPIRSLTLLPGVSNSTDGSTTFNVRGGGDDQNLILLDESTIFNPAHAFGIFSVFNADAIDDIKLYKGGIPARYGGRLSSVLDVRQREGNAYEFEGRGSLGLLASRLAVEGPVGDRGSFLVAGRRTYADLFLKLSSDPDLRQSVAYFYDLNAKVNLRLGSRTRLYASGYFGRDKFKIADLFSSDWGNAAGTLRWNQVFGDRVFANVTASYSDFDYGFEGQFKPSFSWESRIRNLELKADQSWYVSNRHTLHFGAQLSRYEFRPGLVQPLGDSPVLETRLAPRHGLAPALYLSHEIAVGAAFTLEYGARLSNFRRRGEETVRVYAADAPIVYNAALGRYEDGAVVDSVRYPRGVTIASYTHLEPRAALRVGVGEETALKLSYNRTTQSLQLVTNTNSPTPIDVWEPVGPYVQPQTADQVAVGFVTQMGTMGVEASVEAFYKTIDHAVDFIDGADLTLNDHLETEIVQGDGRAYGIELYVRKTSGRLTGWLSYTLGRSELRFAGLSPADPGINDGAWYPAPYDKTHDLSVTGTYPLSDRWTMGSTFVLASGLPATLPESRYRLQDLLFTSYGPRNGARLPLYHRLDLSLTRGTGRGDLVFGVFNVYNRFNAQSLTVRQKVDEPLVAEAIQTSVFGIVPSVSWRFRF